MNIERMKQLAGMSAPRSAGAKLTESVHSPAIADVSHLSKQLSTGEITYNEFKSKLDSLENPTYADADYMDDTDSDVGMPSDNMGPVDTVDPEMDDPFAFGDNDMAPVDSVDTGMDDPFAIGDNTETDMFNDNEFDEAAYDEFSPSGADGPVTDYAGPAGALHGDNPMQKRMQVAEVHRSLVYGYRKFINETRAASTRK